MNEKFQKMHLPNQLSSGNNSTYLHSYMYAHTYGYGLRMKCRSKPTINRFKTNKLTQTNKVIQRCSPFVPTAMILVNKQNLPVNIILIFFISFKEREKWAAINDTSFESNFAVSCVRLGEVMLKQYYLVELRNGSIK